MRSATCKIILCWSVGMFQLGGWVSVKTWSISLSWRYFTTQRDRLMRWPIELTCRACGFSIPLLLSALCEGATVPLNALATECQFSELYSKDSMSLECSVSILFDPVWSCSCSCSWVDRFLLQGRSRQGNNSHERVTRQSQDPREFKTLIALPLFGDSLLLRELNAMITITFGTITTTGKVK